ncbi:hypothetical protein B0H16DRAFT_1616289 [Mycena metata]|uniref:Uncharacterized protein n=1 Tax=Mycena metata TaxID=1033252 RepID=A0AAD7HAH7_9AGAR|nr:hypothetical protein B0H16DRAFT_1616289 [Mycena metata]
MLMCTCGVNLPLMILCVHQDNVVADEALTNLTSPDWPNFGHLGLIGCARVALKPGHLHEVGRKPSAVDVVSLIQGSQFLGICT